jgi:PDZ domain
MDDEPLHGRPLPPDDRLWRHPSELGLQPGAMTLHRRWSPWWTAGLAVVSAVAVTGVVVRLQRTAPATASAVSVPDTTVLTVAATSMARVPTTIAIAPAEKMAPATSVAFLEPPMATNPLAAPRREMVVQWGDGTQRHGELFAPNIIITIGWAAQGTPVQIFDGEMAMIGAWIGGDDATGLGLVRIDNAFLGDEHLGAVSHYLDDLDVLERGLTVIVGDRRIDNVVSMAGPAPIGAGEYADGELIGLTVASGTDGNRQVIPLELSRAVLDHLAVGEPATQPWWGITVASSFGDATNGGLSTIVVSDVEPGSPAAASGITVGDIVLQVDGQRVAHPTDVVLRVRAAGSFVTLDLDRGGALVTVTMAAGTKPAGPANNP